MLIKKIGPFRLNDEDGFWGLEADEEPHCCFSLCRDRLASWFDTDESKPLWVHIHNRPAKDRLEVVGVDLLDRLKVMTRKGITKRIVMCPGWTFDLCLPYPYYAEIVQ